MSLYVILTVFMLTLKPENGPYGSLRYLLAA